MKYKSILFLPVLLLSLIACNSSNYKLNVEPRDISLEYMGRVGETDSTSELYWSGTSVKIEFEGTEVSAILDDERGQNYFNVIIDNDSVYMLKLDSSKVKYQLASNLIYGKHSVQVFKRTEWTKGKTSFYGFYFQKETEVLPIDKKKKVIEFYGDSITSGYAVEDYSGNDSPDSIYTNNFYSYANVTATYFDADYTCISRGGIGLTVSWYPMIMPEMYDRLNPDDENSKWDFSKSSPDVVVVNLFQNDSWLVLKPDYSQFVSKFGNVVPTDEFFISSYKNFISKIREKYNNAEIICILGNMDITQEGSKWPGIVSTAVDNLHDKKISYMFVPYKNTPGHPKIKEQQIIADSLISFINKKVDW